MGIKVTSIILILVGPIATAQEKLDSKTGSWKIVGYAESYFSFSSSSP